MAGLILAWNGAAGSAVFFVLNPENDLESTQKTLAPVFSSREWVAGVAHRVNNVQKRRFVCEMSAV